MNAVIDIGSKQYRVEKKQIVYTEKVPHAIGSTFSVSQVLLVDSKGDVKLGSPYVKDAVVKLKVLEEVKGTKIRGFKYKRRKNYYRQWGHRQRYHKLEVQSISVN